MYATEATRNTVFKLVLALLTSLFWIPVSQAANSDKASSNSIEKSDLNGDLVVDVADLDIFNSRYLEADWMDSDWCGFHDATIAGINYAGSLKKADSL